MIGKRLDCVRYLGPNKRISECERWLRQQSREVGSTFLNLEEVYQGKNILDDDYAKGGHTIQAGNFVEVGKIKF